MNPTEETFATRIQSVIVVPIYPVVGAVIVWPRLLPIDVWLSPGRIVCFFAQDHVNCILMSFSIEWHVTFR